eukprot:10620202-Lingulodinium_polyedra.AAC.1
MHGDHCEMNKTCAKTARSSGTPLGLLWAWLDASTQFSSKDEHKDRDNWPSFPARFEARTLLRKSVCADPWLEAEAGGRDAEEPLEYLGR